MRSFTLLLLIVLVPATTAFGNTGPVVTNVVAMQREDSPWVDVTYDLLGAEDATVHVTLWYSLDGGVSWDRQCHRVRGDVGPGIRPGIGLTASWSAGADLPDHQDQQFSIRVYADDRIWARDCAYAYRVDPHHLCQDCPCTDHDLEDFRDRPSPDLLCPHTGELMFVPSNGAWTVKPNGEDRTLCIDIGSIANENGYVLLDNAFWDMGMTDPEGNQAIVICGYEYYGIAQIYFNMSNTYVYCNDGAVINGIGENNGFLSYPPLLNTSIRNCHVKNFYRGMNFMGCGCGIYDNKVENAEVGIKGCLCDSHIKGNDIRDLYGSYARGIEHFNLAANDAYFALIEDNYVENGKIGIYGIHSVLIRNNRIHNGTFAGIQVEFSSLVENNVVTGSRWGIYARVDNNRSRGGVAIHDNLVDHPFGYGIYTLSTNGFNPSTPLTEELAISIVNNTVVGAGWNGIYANWNNLGLFTPNFHISGNRVVGVNPGYPESPYYGISARRQANGITVEDNTISRRPFALECAYSQGINWRHNCCERGSVNNHDDSCTPVPECQACIGAKFEYDRHRDGFEGPMY